MCSDMRARCCRRLMEDLSDGDTDVLLFVGSSVKPEDQFGLVWCRAAAACLQN